ncbi:MAG: flavin reductase domain protein FMN-binding protein [Clostridiales bacterium]|jgi:flavin reductase (DIM6/NTAB) family NADH-FMN oxidoreductase RutF|nr:flavin reductase domain protein FMN-binding protein [Clostridiales bacterium]
MFKSIKYTEMSKEMLQQLPKGAFLTVKDGDKLNTMTIGWGSIGYMWNKPVFIAMVRYSRHTFDLIERAQNFTVSYPLNGQLKEALKFCGTKSGRDMDKIKECNLKLSPGNRVNTPIIEDCDLHFECKIIYKHPMDEQQLTKEIRDRAYPEGDYHMMYFGEILDVSVRE